MQLTSIFDVFGIVRFLLNAETFILSLLLLYINIFVCNTWTVLVAIHFGSSTTEEAEASYVAVVKSMNQPAIDETQSNRYISLLTQMRSRNLNLKNKFFNVNWNVVLAVRIDF
jgi:hypothetical protein